MADVIICLGAGFYSPETIENMTLRTDKAIELYKKKTAKKIIFTGGSHSRKDVSEAKFMSDYAIKRGVPKKDILLEERARNTVGNAFYCRRIMVKKHFKSAIVVTSPFHIRRTKYIFKKIIPDKELSFDKGKGNLGFFGLIRRDMIERWSLLKLRIKGIDISDLR